MYTSGKPYILHIYIKQFAILLYCVGKYSLLTAFLSGRAGQGRHRRRRQTALYVLFLPVTDLHIPSLPDCLLPFRPSERL